MGEIGIKLQLMQISIPVYSQKGKDFKMTQIHNENLIRHLRNKRQSSVEKQPQKVFYLKKIRKKIMCLIFSKRRMITSQGEYTTNLLFRRSYSCD